MSRQTHPLQTWTLAVALVLPACAYANAGIPMLALAWPAQWLAFIPIVAIECEVFRRDLKVPFGELIWPMAKANFQSTLVGVPLAWLGMLLVELAVGGVFAMVPDSLEIPKVVHYALFPLMAAWVGDNIWQVFAAFLVLAVPFCIVSIYIERWTLRRALTEQDGGIVNALTRRANIFSYAVLCCFALIYALLVPK